MYQQRWKNLAIDEELPAYAVPVAGFNSVVLYRVLQYKVMTNIAEFGLQEPIWSEWEDVTYGDGWNDE